MTSRYLKTPFTESASQTASAGRAWCLQKVLLVDFLLGPVVSFILSFFDDLYHARFHLINFPLLIPHPILDLINPIVHIIELFDLQVTVFALLLLS